MVVKWFFHFKEYAIMLIRFRVGNFLSFNEMVEFSSIAGKVRNKSEHLETTKDVKLLRFTTQELHHCFHSWSFPTIVGANKKCLGFPKFNPAITQPFIVMNLHILKCACNTPSHISKYTWIACSESSERWWANNLIVWLYSTCSSVNS